jgi:2-keto-3-deoxy-L-rhamnonate aldolase RhmA|tara:strand:+ start:741 stop:1481 length:741 start_codon:yes stop_codon:yes gene_type:complete
LKPHGAYDIKKRIKNKEEIIGVSIPITSSKGDIEKILNKNDFDFISTDSQHSPFNEETLVQFCEYTNNLGIPVNFRIKNTKLTYLIGNILDLGPSGIEVPQVENINTVNEAVDNFYFPKKGKRSWGGGPKYISHENFNRIQTADWWNSHGILWMQIESLNSVTSAHKIAEIDGVDVISWGPNDLAFDMEMNPYHPLKSDEDCIRHVMKLLLDSDTQLCVRAFKSTDKQKYLDMGIKMILESGLIYK